MSLRMIAVMASLRGLTSLCQRAIFGFQRLVEVHRDQRGHVQRLADMSAAAARII